MLAGRIRTEHAPIQSTSRNCAAKKAVNNEGIFTPGQWNQAVREADNSVRKRNVARGEALGQDLGDAAQSVLGNKYPDSGTAGRLMNGAAIVSGVHMPVIPMALGAGAGLYTRPVQNMLRELILRRPDAAPQVANHLRRLSAPATVGVIPLEQGY